MRMLAGFGAVVAAVAVAAVAVLAASAVAQDAPPGTAAPPPEKQIDRGTLVVRAATGEGAAIAGAVAEAWLVPAPTEATWGISETEPTLVVYAATDAAGVAKIPVEAPATWRVSVRAPGRATETRTLRVGPGVVRDETFHLAAGFALEGRVADGAGAGVAGATVYAGRVGWEGDLAHFLVKSMTDAEGRYRLDGLPKGPVDLWLRRGGRFTWTARLDVPGFERFDVSVRRGGRMTGFVWDDATGTPVSGARVRAFDFGGDCVAECVSGGGGAYTLDAAEPRVAVDRIVVDAPGRVLVRDDPKLPPARRIVLAAGGTYDCDLRLRRAARVVGTVTGDGKPVAGATVTLWARSDAPRASWDDPTTTTTGADGAYWFDGVDTGAVVAYVAARGWKHPGFPERFAPDLPRLDKAPVAARATVPQTGDVRIDVALERAEDAAADAIAAGRTFRTATGRVMDEQNRPVPGIEVSSGVASSISAADGTFRVQVDVTEPATGSVNYAIPRQVVLTLRGDGFDEQNAAIELEAEAAVVVLRATPPVPVRVVGPDGKPVPGATVTLGERDGDSMGGIRQWPPVAAPVAVTTGPDGIATFPRSRVRDLYGDVVVRAPGFATARIGRGHNDFTVGDTIDVTLAPGRDVVVTTVSGTPPTPVAGAWLTLGPDEDAGPPSISALPQEDQRSEVYVGRTGAEGTCRLRDVGPDPARVHAYAAGHYAVERRIDAATTSVTIDMNAHLSLSGRFVLEDGSAGAGVMYSVHWVDHPEGWPCFFGPWISGPNGEFRLDATRPGTYEVEAMRDTDDGVPDYAPMTAGPYRAGTKDIVVTLRKGRHLTGVVVGSDGKGVADAVLAISPTREFGVSFVRNLPTGADGAFTVDRAPQGPVHVQVVDDSGEGGRARRVVVLGPIDPKADEPLRIVLDEGLAIAGRLLDDDGQAMSGRPLVAIPADVTEWSWDPRCGCVTGDDGRFRIPGLARGSYRIWYAAHDWRLQIYDGGNGPGPHALDPEGGTPAGTKDLTLTWK